MQILNQVKKQIKIVLQLDDRFDCADAATRLLGEIPELDSMAVVSLITAIEDAFEIEFADDELHGEAFATVGSLARLVEDKLQGRNSDVGNPSRAR